jgi:hypothetical protein
LPSTIIVSKNLLGAPAETRAAGGWRVGQERASAVIGSII